jgi:hypothetical protein
MVNRDYTKEIGIDSGNKTIPWPLAAALIALTAVGGWYVVGEVRVAAQKEHEQRLAAQAAAAASQPAKTYASK